MVAANLFRNNRDCTGVTVTTVGQIDPQLNALCMAFARAQAPRYDVS